MSSPKVKYCRVCRRRPAHPRWTSRICTGCHNRRYRARKTAWQRGTDKGREQTLRSAARRPRHKWGTVGLSLTSEEWVRLWRTQGGRCAICLSALRNKYDALDDTRLIANADHGHAEEKALLAAGVGEKEAVRRSMRGLLCYFCNRNVLAVALRDDPDKAQRAADYLRNPPAKGVICAGN